MNFLRKTLRVCGIFGLLVVVGVFGTSPIAYPLHRYKVQLRLLPEMVGAENKASVNRMIEELDSADMKRTEIDADIWRSINILSGALGGISILLLCVSYSKFLKNENGA